MDILVLNSQEMQEVISMEEAIEANKEALKAYAKGEADIPLRVNLDIEEFKGQSLYMPGYLKSHHALGVKLVSVYPENKKKGLLAVPSLMLVLDDQTGMVKAMMDGSYLTQLRTAALVGAATDLLAPRESSVFSLIGTGGQAPLQLEAVLAVRDIKKVYVADLREDNRREFVGKMRKRLAHLDQLEILEAQDLEEAIGQSDIITTVTTSKKPTFKSDWVKDSCHINAVGSYTPSMVETDGDLIVRAQKTYYDTRDALRESGDFLSLLDSGRLREEDLTGQLGDLLLSKIAARESEDEISFFKTTGNAVFDLVVANKIYLLAQEKNIGQKISL